MSTIEPITGAPVPEMGDTLATHFGTTIPNAIYALAKHAARRYDSTADRDFENPTPEGGEFATVLQGTNSYPTWHDGTSWRGLLIEQPPVDGGYPVAAAAVTSETVISRITVPARDYARRVSAVGSTFASYTQANDVDLRIYAGGTLVNQNRRRMAVSIGDSWSATTSPIALAAGASLIIELRINRASGTGSVSTTASVSTTLAATVTPV